jgi:ABC-type Fe3+ transport system permease subunit
MSEQRQTSYGRAAMIGVLIALLLLICVGTYLILGRFPRTDAMVPGEDAVARNRETARLSLLLATLLMSALLILLFVLGSYLLIRIGRAIKAPVGGKPTEYVDAWQQYRLTDDDIASATAESPDDREPPATPDDEDERDPTS